jgi:rhodanese-related sulfurtransferase
MIKAICSFIVFSISLSLICVPAIANNLNEIDGKMLEIMMADGKGIRIVDVRETDEFAAGHIKGAINIPYEPAKSKIFKELLPQDRIVFVCHGGPMGHELGTLLVKANYSSVYNLIGGMKKWRGDIVK